jgi:NAD(P)H-hydrate repair Nnr-like enzyme with NAD(P)H-hydrate epimerase domain
MKDRLLRLCGRGGRGGDGFPKEDQIAWNSDLVREYNKKIAKSKPDAFIVNASFLPGLPTICGT